MELLLNLSTSMMAVDTSVEGLDVTHYKWRKSITVMGSPAWSKFGEGGPPPSTRVF